MRNVAVKFPVYSVQKRTELPRFFHSSFTLFFVIIIWLSTSSGVLALEVGSVAPDFELQTLDGNPVRLSDYRGGLVILKLATTWCPSCQQQDAAINALSGFLVEHDIALVEVFIGENEDAVRRSQVGRQSAFRHRVLLDPSGDVFNGLYQGYVIPRVLLLNQDSRVRHDGTLISAAQLRLKLQKLVSESSRENHVREKM